MTTGHSINPIGSILNLVSCKIPFLLKMLPVSLRPIGDFLDIERARDKYEISSYISKLSNHSIAHGSRGDVFAAHLWDNNRRAYQNVVVKVFRGTYTETLKVQKRLLREIAVWAYLNHPNIATFYGITFKFGPMPGIVSPLIKNDLMDYTENRLNDRLRLIHEIASGLKYLHAKYVIHGDLKPANVRVSACGVAQILDFGMGRIDNTRGFTTSFDPNPRYMAPETFPCEDDSSIRLTFRSDVFSFAMLMLQVLHGRDLRLDQQGTKLWDYSQPFNHIALDWSLWDRVRKGERPFQNRYRGITQNQWRLMEGCWHRMPHERPSAQEIELCIGLELQGYHGQNR
ncbi:kinase-like domain-containing protein [Collybia nuda]|uniref:Kinase-like domain-containing protein n=1 Tax=Collybia nuda TaxID=64659 RepID=A0A9P6CHS2_9AGAR|nr:kinase-like domain-containing protein [Collybia nuda]